MPMATTVILGSGIIGLSTAYYLSEHQPGSSIHLVEPSPRLFASASGLAGGFLARDWFSPAAAALGALSFDEHRTLAEREGGRKNWGYAPSTALSHVHATNGGNHRDEGRGDDWLRHGTSRSGAANGKQAATRHQNLPSWLTRTTGHRVEVISTDGETAQVDPLRLCQFLLKTCLSRGVHLHQPAAALSVSTDVRSELASIRIGHTLDSTETDLPCTRVLFAAGAWSSTVFASLFSTSTFRLPVTSLAGYSLLLRLPEWSDQQLSEEGEEMMERTKPERASSQQSCHALFSTIGDGFSPEVFSRIGGDIYVAGLNPADLPLPRLPADTQLMRAPLELLKEAAKQLLGPELITVREGLCFRPVTPSGRPIISRVSDEHLGVGIKTRAGSDGGVFVATGHGPWGISMSLGTGKVMAEMMQGRPLSADVASLNL